MEYLKVFSELISALAWPLTLLFLMFYFKDNLEKLFHVFVKRFERTSQVEFPGGFKAVFFEEKIESVKQIAEEAISAISSDFTDEQKNSIKKHIETALINEEIPLFILSHISSFGLLSRDRLYEFTKESGLKNIDIDMAIDSLLELGYVIKKEGTLHVTHEGVKRLRYEEGKPKLTRRCT